MTKESLKRATVGNTMQSVAPFLLLCLAISVLGRAYPQFIEERITDAAVGGTLAGIGALVWRYAKSALTKS